MSMFCRKTLLGVSVFAFLVFATSMVLAQEEESEPVAVGNGTTPPEIENPIPEEWVDPAFDQYIDVRRLRSAWATLEPAALVDAALQLVEGERVLFRSHKAVKADEVFRFAIKVAAEKRDKETLARLKHLAAALRRTQMSMLISAAERLLDQPRATINTKVALDEVTPHQIRQFENVTQAIEHGRILGDRKLLESVRSVLTDDDFWPKSLKDDLFIRLSNAERTAGDTPNPTAAALDKLAGSTRSLNKWTFKNPLWLPVSYSLIWIPNGGTFFLGPGQSKDFYAIQAFIPVVKVGNTGTGADTFAKGIRYNNVFPGRYQFYIGNYAIRMKKY